MYNVTPGAREAWTALFAWVSRTAGIALDIVDHPAPASLEELWQRPDMGCVFMCGWPFNRSNPKPQIVAAPCPLGPRYKRQPIYFTDMIVRRDRMFETLKDTFGGRIAWTVDSSHSGFNAPRHHLLAYRTSQQPKLYSESVGPFLTPEKALASVVEGTVDIAPMDSYALDLIALHEPERIREIMVIDSTAAAPFPPLVASNGISPSDQADLRQAFLMADSDPAITPVLDALNISAFTTIKPQSYDLALRWQQDAVSAGYHYPA